MRRLAAVCEILARAAARSAGAVTWWRTRRESRFLEGVYAEHVEANDRARRVLGTRADPPLMDPGAERCLPGCEPLPATGWTRTMLLRYALAMHYSGRRDVLDTCSGLGWGAYLLDAVARSVTCVEMHEPSIAQSRRLWPTGRTMYVRASVLAMPLADEAFDVVTAMESIEHFRREDIVTYLAEMHRVLRPGGIVVGSSAFPYTRPGAERLRARNVHHLHVCTRSEIQRLLVRAGFSDARVFANGMFFTARKHSPPAVTDRGSRAGAA